MTETRELTVPPSRRQVRVVEDSIPALDTAKFEHMQRFATAMAYSTFLPDALCKVKVDRNLVSLEPQEIVSNCFMVVNQAFRWGMDPFAVAACVSIVHGKLCYEGKLIAALIEAKLGIQLEYEIAGQGEAMQVIVSGAIEGRPVLDSKGKPKIVSGTVGDWKTTGEGSPWAAKGGYPRMLRYRGAREWARVHAPSLMLGVYSDDEMQALTDERRARNARPVDAARIDDDEPHEPPADTSTQDAVNLVEGGLSDGKQVLWEDDEPDAVPADAKAAEPITKETLLDGVARIGGLEASYKWMADHEALIEKLPTDHANEVNRSFLSKQGALRRAQNISAG